MNENSQNFNPEEILNNLLREAAGIKKESLKELFDRRIDELKITPTTALEILKIESRTLKGILEGTQIKRIDFINIVKIASFLQLPKEQVIGMYVESIEKSNPDKIPISSEKIEFIKENFDLAVLRKAGFIESITDFIEIEKNITYFFGLNSILEYQKPHVDIAFSAGLIKPKNELTRTTWIAAARDTFEEINNPNEYDRDALVKYFPEIRWHSMNVEMGLLNVIKVLYKMGVTIIYQAPLPTLHLRGATFMVNNKPCIVLTNYVGFYPTLWFALIHELFHVIFDWEEIRANRYHYHLSDETSEQLTVIEREKEADAFAREYLFSVEKTKKIRPSLHNRREVEEFADNNHVHASFIYVFNAKDVGDKDRMAWARARRNNPTQELNQLLEPISNPWNKHKPIKDFVKSIEYKLYK